MHATGSNIRAIAIENLKKGRAPMFELWCLNSNVAGIQTSEHNSAPMFECWSAADDHRGKSFSVCRGGNELEWLYAPETPLKEHKLF